jgi:hypothetical protein
MPVHAHDEKAGAHGVTARAALRAKEGVGVGRCKLSFYYNFIRRLFYVRLAREPVQHRPHEFREGRVGAVRRIAARSA